MRFQFGFSKEDEQVLGTILTLGNGQLGVRGEFELERSPYGTIVSGVYDYTPYFYRELVNGPRTIGMIIIIDGELINPSSQKVKEFQRELDIEKGLLRTHLEIETKNGNKILYKSTRIVHMKRKNLILLDFELKASKGGIAVVVNPIEFNTANPGFIDEIMIKHYRVDSIKETEEGVYARVKTLDNKYTLEIASSLVPSEYQSRSTFRTDNEIGEIYIVKLKPGKTYKFTKYVTVSKGAALEELKDVKRLGFEKLYEEHINSWKRIWEKVKVEIEGDKDLENALNFNIFHLIQSLPPTDKVSLPARGIHGFGYRGHIFWDTEIYALPFFIFTMPKEARRLLLYRCNNLDAAKENAKMNGYQGVQFPWESADDGREATPSEIPLDMLGRKIVRIYTGEEEHHITADIAYIVDFYYQVSGDLEFMNRCGLEIIFETARFWASRVEFEEGKGYVIKKVIGPDEYHEHVNNNFFTNLMAKHNLELAIRYFRESKNREPWKKIVEKLNIREEEVEKWEEIAKNMYIPRKIDGVFEEFDGYFELMDFEVDPFNIGEKTLPEEIRNNIGKTKLVKQADVIMAQYLLKDYFSPEEIKSNFNYYIRRTTHASSLSMPPYAIIATWIGEVKIAYEYFKRCANIDLKNVYGNTAEGFHLATAGGTWQVLVRGFCGLNVKGNKIELNPNLPEKWKYVKFRIFFKGSWIEFKISRKKVRARMLEGSRKVKISSFGKEVDLYPGKEVVIVAN